MCAVREDRIRDVEAKHPDPRVIVIWGIRFIVPASAILLILLLVFWVFPISLFGQPATSTGYILLIFFLLVVFPYLTWAKIEHDHYIYYMTGTEMVVKKGVIESERHVIPYEKIQHIHISISILERIFHLASLRIETAAQSGLHSEIIIPAVANYRGEVQYLLDMVEKSKNMSYEEKTHDHEVIDLLKSINSELKELKNVTLRVNMRKKPKN